MTSLHLPWHQNPRAKKYNITPAVDVFSKNYEYLNDRTGEVHYFIPGFKNDARLIGHVYGQNWESFQLSEATVSDATFYPQCLLETVDWLESNCPTYEYKEGIDLILLKSYGVRLNAKLDVQNLICLPLDDIYKNGGNVIETITSVRKIVSQNLSFGEAKRMIAAYLESAMINNCQPKRVKVFIAGSKLLSHERNAVRSELQQVSNRTNIEFASYTYEDFSRSFVNEGRQSEYNNFIANEADFAVFIIDGTIGGITFDEFNIAMSAFRNNGKPCIYTYCKNVDSDDLDIKHIIDDINHNHQYYCEYGDIFQLESEVYRDFMDIAWKLVHENYV